MKKRVLASLAVGAVLAGSAIVACSGDDTNPAAPGDAGADTTTDQTAPDTGTDSGTDAGTDAADGSSPYSPRAQKGLDISPVPIPTTGLTTAQIEQLGRGSYLVNAVASCPDCHNQNGASGVKFLAGGTPFPVDATHVVYSRNLTPDPTGLTLGESAFLDVMHEGKDIINPGHILLVMPWPHYRWMTTSDLKAIYAYLKVIPAVQNAVPADVKAGSDLDLPDGGALPAAPTQYDEGQVPRALPGEDGGAQDDDYATRGLAIRPFEAPGNLASLPADKQAQIGRGAYLANAAVCSECHSNEEREFRPAQATFLKLTLGNYLTGGRVFPTPPGLNAQLKQVRSMSADLVGQNNGFFNEPEDTLQRFVSIIQTGTHADESTDGAPARALGWPMPWPAFKNMIPADLEAIYTYVKTVPARTGNDDKVTEDYARYCTKDGDCDTTGGETCAKATLGDGGTAASGECVNQACTADTDCNACQTCTASGNTKCAAPAPSSPCVNGAGL